MRQSLTAPRWRGVIGPAFLLVLLTVAAFSNSFSVPFILDDNSSIKNNVSIRELWPIAPAEIGGTRGRPLANFSLALNYWCGGTAVTGYHGINLAIHALAGLTLFGLVRRTAALPIFGAQFAERFQWMAFAVAVLWLVHPLQTESVTYVVQRTESLMGLHYFLVLYCFVRAIQSPDRRRAWQALAIAACFAGTMCKEIIVTAPLAVLLFDRTFVAGTFKAAWQQRGLFYLGLVSSWLLLAWLMTGTGNRGVGFGEQIGPWTYALTESCAIVRYFRLAIWPAPLVFDYGADFATSLREVWLCALLVIAGLAAAIVALRIRPVLGFLLVWPFLTLAPTSSFVPLALQPVAEHRMYLPLAGLLTLLVVGFYRWLPRHAWIFVGLAAACLGTATYRRNAVYADEIRLWQDTVEKRPNNDRARQNLGTALLHAGRTSEAEVELNAAMALNAENYQALNNLGFLYARTGREMRAIETFEKTLRVQPGFTEARYNLGCVLRESGQIPRAREQFERVVGMDAGHGDAHINLAAILVAEGKFNEAAAHFTAALSVQPRDPELYVQRAFAHYQCGRLAAAIKDYERALELRPDFSAAAHNLKLLRQSSEAAPR